MSDVGGLKMTEKGAPTFQCSMFDLTLLIRILDMQRMCESLSKQCGEQGKSTLGVKLRQASSSFGAWAEDIRRSMNDDRD
jgi:hypothetical protein